MNGWKEAWWRNRWGRLATLCMVLGIVLGCLAFWFGSRTPSEAWIFTAKRAAVWPRLFRYTLDFIFLWLFGAVWVGIPVAVVFLLARGYNIGYVMVALGFSHSALFLGMVCQAAILTIGGAMAMCSATLMVKAQLQSRVQADRRWLRRVLLARLAVLYAFGLVHLWLR